MKCPNCGRGIEGGWNYCPGCGSRFRRDLFSSIFDRMFSSMNRELKEMDRMMEKNIEALDISPFFIRPFRATASAKGPNAQNRQQGRPFRASIKPQGSGFSIRITRSGISPPRVSVRTFGNMDRERVREQMARLGFKTKDKPMGYVRKPLRMEGEPKIEGPRSVEEPKTEVKRLDGRVVVNLEMPGVKSPDDIDIKELESSLEVKAVAGNRAYFKILTKPGQFRLAKRNFSRGVLHLEFS